MRYCILAYVIDAIVSIVVNSLVRIGRTKRRLSVAKTQRRMSASVREERLRSLGKLTEVNLERR